MTDSKRWGFPSLEDESVSTVDPTPSKLLVLSKLDGLLSTITDLGWIAQALCLHNACFALAYIM